MTTETNTADTFSNTDASEDNDEVVVVEKTREATEYEKKLRAEARRANARVKTLQEEHAADKAKIEAEYKAALADRENAVRERLTTAELKAQAMKANVIDPDVLKLMDRSTAKYNADGELTNAAEMIDAFRAAKPHLFSSQTSVAFNAPAPKQGTAGEKPDFKSMTPAQLRAFEQKLARS